MSKTIYEWSVLTMVGNAEGDVADVSHWDTAAEALAYIANSSRDEAYQIELVRDVWGGPEGDDLEDRQWAPVVSDVLEATTTDGTPIPKRFAAEWRKAWAAHAGTGLPLVSV